ncbi:MAG: hypothetical protein V7K66_30285 [Nostoc sp.]
MITASVQKSGKSLSPCPLHPWGLNDKSLPEHDMTDKFLVETAIYRVSLTVKINLTDY